MERVRRAFAVAAAAAGLVLLPTGVAHAASPGSPPPGTPAGTGGGCQQNGQAVSGATRTLAPFGTFVRTQAPIADDNAAFFTDFCK